MRAYRAAGIRRRRRREFSARDTANSQRVASTLLNRGRCSALTVSRLAALPLQTTQASLLILLQHHLVGSTGGSRRSPPEEEMYEFDIVECLMRLRWGRMLALTEKEFGQEVSYALEYS